MNDDIRALEPKDLWKNFADLNAVPRASKKEEQVIAFAKGFGEKLGLDTKVDHIGNVIIKKPATPGMEGRKTVVLQSHLDMVHQKNNDTEFDFDTEGIKMIVDGDWVKAEGTTLGADNGIGVATIMALLESSEIPHPPLEALFTIDEETGMTGALELKGGLLDADIMLNLDTEDDRELTIGCAGGIDINVKGAYRSIMLPTEEYQGMTLIVKGLSGGHSGMDIHLGKGNANKIANRLLQVIMEEYELYISTIDGGGLRNAIPRESVVTCAIRKEDIARVAEVIELQTNEVISEYRHTDPDLEIKIETSQVEEAYMPAEDAKALIKAIAACHNGIYRMSPTIGDLVQTSNNLARVEVKNSGYTVLCLTRSSVDSEKHDLVRSISSIFELIGATVSTSGSYPGWTPDPDSSIVTLMSNKYKELFDEEPHVNACHAGLECGILGTNYPDMEMISFGPNIRGAHSPDERVQISSVQKFWGYLLNTLADIPIK